MSNYTLFIFIYIWLIISFIIELVINKKFSLGKIYYILLGVVLIVDTQFLNIQSQVFDTIFTIIISISLIITIRIHKKRSK